MRLRESIAVELRSSGSVFAEGEADLLMSEARDETELVAMVQRRVNGEPIQVIVGWAEFCGIRIVVKPGVFVPRSRTEFLAQRAIALGHGIEHPVVADLCCGAGAIATAVTNSLDCGAVYASDIHDRAVDCARANLGDRGHALHGDLYETLPPDIVGKVDLLAVNAPYVPTESISLMPAEARLHEVRVALDGGADGLDVQRRVAAGAATWLSADGWVLMETSKDQATESAKLFRGTGLEATVETNEELDATIVVASRVSH
jgi:release factor glutamine methyltransferase